MPKKLAFSLLWLVLSLGLAFAEPIRVHPANPHYYLFNGEPTVLVTSAEHYGGVVNREFDYVTYFDAFHAYGLNYTRDLSGSFSLSRSGKFGNGNTLGVKACQPDGPLGAEQCSRLRVGGATSLTSIAGTRSISSG